MINDQPVRFLCHIGLSIVRAVAQGKLDSLQNDPSFDKALQSIDDLEFFLNLASEASIGEWVDTKEVQSLLLTGDQNAAYIVIDVASGTTERWSVENILSGGILDSVGIVLLKEHQPKWAFWRSFEYDYTGARLLELPEWQKSTL